MSTAHTQAGSPFPGINEFVSSDFSALASHMNACQRSQGRFFRLRATLEFMHAYASPRIVTTAALFAACGLGLLALA
jgi:hypothetical protein